MLGTAVYGTEFVSVVARDGVFGAQFHPEKSGPDGLRLLAQLRGAVRRGRMILLPAVDIRDGKAVRLRQGHFDQETVYADDPLEAARSFVEAGARYLHVVDLDGARDGEPANLDHLKRIAREPACRCSTAAACGRSCRSARRWPPAPSAWWWAPRPTTTRSSWRRRSPPGALRVLVAVDVRGGTCRCPAGRARPRCGRRS